MVVGDLVLVKHISRLPVSCVSLWCENSPVSFVVVFTTLYDICGLSSINKINQNLFYLSLFSS